MEVFSQRLEQEFDAQASEHMTSHIRIYIGISSLYRPVFRTRDVLIRIRIRIQLCSIVTFKMLTNNQSPFSIVWLHTCQIRLHPSSKITSYKEVTKLRY
jgi:hypothetical protein